MIGIGRLAAKVFRRCGIEHSTVTSLAMLKKNLDVTPYKEIHDKLRTALERRLERQQAQWSAKFATGSYDVAQFPRYGEWPEHRLLLMLEMKRAGYMSKQIEEVFGLSPSKEFQKAKATKVETPLECYIETEISRFT